MGNVSNYKKATLFFSDITDTAVTAKKEQSFTLQRFGLHVWSDAKLDGQNPMALP